MATNKPKIQGYIEQNTFDCFETYRQANNLSQSHALEKILASFFGNDHIAKQPDSFEFNQMIMERLDRFNDRVSQIERRVLEISFSSTNNPESDTSEITNNLGSDTLEITNNLGSDTSEITNNLESDTSEIADLVKGISQRLLGKRLGCSHTFVAKLRSLGKIGSYSKQHDPDGLEWEFRDGKYYPAAEVSTSRSIAVK